MTNFLVMCGCFLCYALILSRQGQHPIPNCPEAVDCREDKNGYHIFFPRPEIHVPYHVTINKYFYDGNETYDEEVIFDITSETKNITKNGCELTFLPGCIHIYCKTEKMKYDQLWLKIAVQFFECGCNFSSTLGVAPNTTRSTDNDTTETSTVGVAPNTTRSTDNDTTETSTGGNELKIVVIVIIVIIVAAVIGFVIVYYRRRVIKWLRRKCGHNEEIAVDEKNAGNASGVEKIEISTSSAVEDEHDNSQPQDIHINNVATYGQRKLVTQPTVNGAPSGASSVESEPLLTKFSEEVCDDLKFKSSSTSTPVSKEYYAENAEIRLSTTIRTKEIINNRKHNM